jgi:hypothetical protein
MKTNYFFATALTFLIGFTSYSQGELFYLDFEGSDPLTNLPTGVTNVNSSTTVRVKDNTDYPPVNNAVEADPDEAGENELFLDFHGYLKIDVENPSNGFSLAYDYRRNDDNDDWWLGFLSFVGNDGVENRLEQLLIREWDGQLNFGDVNTGGNKPIGFLTNYHVVVIINESGDLITYVNGAEVLNVPNTTTNHNINTWTNASLLLSFKGSDFDGTDVTPEPEYQTNARDARAFVDNIALFDRTLTPDEVTEIFNNGNNTLSIESQILKNSLSIYPNPVREVLNFSSQDVKSVDVFSISGAKVLSKEVTNASLDLSSLEAGTYIIQCKDFDGNKIKILRAIKQ